MRKRSTKRSSRLSSVFLCFLVELFQELVFSFLTEKYHRQRLHVFPLQPQYFLFSQNNEEKDKTLGLIEMLTNMKRSQNTKEVDNDMILSTSSCFWPPLKDRQYFLSFKNNIIVHFFCTSSCLSVFSFLAEWNGRSV